MVHEGQGLAQTCGASEVSLVPELTKSSKNITANHFPHDVLGTSSFENNWESTNGDGSIKMDSLPPQEPDTLVTINRGALIGLLVVAVAVAMVIIISLLMVRRKPYGTISHGIVEVRLERTTQIQSSERPAQ